MRQTTESNFGQAVLIVLVQAIWQPLRKQGYAMHRAHNEGGICNDLPATNWCIDPQIDIVWCKGSFQLVQVVANRLRLVSNDCRVVVRLVRPTRFGFSDTARR